ncbi:helix-turn-helix domain-containing protein [Candidatus Micrarchaeota archaeon]|nr:helix-turn-helix domain-containing protein [Candidatus Micrarchaeota archaeon]
MLEKLLRSNAEVKILGVVLFADGLHLREIARQAGVSPSEAKRELDTLVSTGVLKTEKKGNLALFHQNESCPFLAELKGLYLKTEGVFAQLREGLSGLKGVEFAFVYGSFARGDERGTSDIDLMVVGKPDTGGIHKRIMKIEGKMGREINYSIYSLREIQRKATLSGFIKELIAGKKVFVVGLENEFERFAETGLSKKK